MEWTGFLFFCEALYAILLTLLHGRKYWPGLLALFEVAWCTETLNCHKLKCSVHLATFHETFLIFAFSCWKPFLNVIWVQIDKAHYENLKTSDNSIKMLIFQLLMPNVSFDVIWVEFASWKRTLGKNNFSRFYVFFLILNVKFTKS